MPALGVLRSKKRRALSGTRTIASNAVNFVFIRL